MNALKVGGMAVLKNEKALPRESFFKMTFTIAAPLSTINIVVKVIITYTFDKLWHCESGLHIAKIWIISILLTYFCILSVLFALARNDLRHYARR